MAVLSDEERRRCWARIMRDIAWRAWPSDLPKSDLRAAVNAVDDWAESNAASYNSALPAAYRTTATADQKALLLAAVLMRRAGRFDTEEDE